VWVGPRLWDAAVKFESRRTGRVRMGSAENESTSVVVSSDLVIKAMSLT
jgi:hypothetical protein